MKTITIIPKFLFKSTWENKSPDTFGISIENHSEPDHIFPNDPNILNLDFDDATESHTDDQFPISRKQASKLLDFILEHQNSNFIIHCSAGKSRSQGVGEAINAIFPDRFKIINRSFTPNIYVKSMILQEFRNRLT